MSTLMEEQARAERERDVANQVEQTLEGVELLDDTLYAVVQPRTNNDVRFAYGATEVRRLLAEMIDWWTDGRLLVMPVSRTVLAEWKCGAGPTHKSDS